MKKVAVVILNWNGQQYLERFLPSVMDSTYPNLDIYVADNASTDGSVAWLWSLSKQTTLLSNSSDSALHRWKKEVFIIQNKDNFGFAQGYNEALKQVTADYYVLLNSDVLVAPDWIEPIIALLDSDESIAACQPKILSQQTPILLEHAGAAGGWIDKFGYPFCRGRVFNVCEKDTGQYDDTAEVAWATGTALFIRSHIYHALGGLNDSFFAHMEEIDLCWRVRRLGYKVMVCPSSVVWHVGGGTLQKANPFKTYLNFRNNWAMLLQNLPLLDFFIILPVRLLLDAVALFSFVAKRERGDAKALLKAHLHFWGRIPSILQTRWQTNRIIAEYRLQKASCSKPNMVDRSQQQGYYKGSIVFDFFVRRKKLFSDIVPR